MANESRSELRRQAAMRGEPAPDFSGPSEADVRREQLAQALETIEFWKKNADDWQKISLLLGERIKELEESLRYHIDVETENGLEAAQLRLRVKKLEEALAVLVLTPLTRRWLETNDPMALQQAFKALPQEYLDDDPDDAA